MNLCVKHLEEVETDLLQAGEWAETVQETISRQDVSKPQGERVAGSSDKPMPYNVGASETLHHLKATLVSWAMLVHEEAAVDLDCKDEVGSIGDYLGTHIGWIRKHDTAGDFYAEIRHAVKQCEWAVDRAEAKVFAGMCPTEDCDTPVYAKAGNIMARCQVCMEEWDVSEWRGRALDYARFVSGTAAELSRMLTDPITKEALPAATIRSWARRKRITPCTEGDSPEYYIDEVRRVWAESMASKYNPRKVA